MLPIALNLQVGNKKDGRNMLVTTVSVFRFKLTTSLRVEQL